MGPGCSVEIPSECRGPSQEATWCPAVSTKASCSAVATKLLQRVALAESDPERGHFLIPDCFRDLQGLPVSGDSVLLLLAVFFPVPDASTAASHASGSERAMARRPSLASRCRAWSGTANSVGAVLPAQTRSLK